MPELVETWNPQSIDYQALIKLAGTRSPEDREAVFRTVSQLLVDYGAERTERERSLAGDTLRHLLGEVERTLRWELASRLATRSDVPQSLIAALAMDEIEVAEEVLRESPLLDDPLLIEIIHHKAEEHALAIARRRSLSADVSQALIDTESVRVITAVIENAGAELTTDMLEFLTEESRTQDLYHDHLVRRADLPEALAKRLYQWVAEPIKRHICARYELDPKILESEIAAAIDESVAAAPSAGRRTSKARTLVERLHAKSALDHRFLLGALYRGHFEVFKEGVIELTALDSRLVERILHDRDPRGMAVICRLLGADSRAFENMVFLTRHDRGRPYHPDPGERGRLRTLYAAIPGDLAGDVANAWRDNPDYRLGLGSVLGGSSAP
jgi:uncharacterized protein (DUF2336 family)